MSDDWPDDEEDVCGWTYDHTTRITHEDEDGVQWECTNCGAEGWEDHHLPAQGPERRGTWVND